MKQFILFFNFRSRWYNNELICGGYSHLTTKCDLSYNNKKLFHNGYDETNDDDGKPENLAHPVYVQTHKSTKVIFLFRVLLVSFFILLRPSLNVLQNCFFIFSVLAAVL